MRDEIISILMKRDSLKKNEAEQLLDETMEEVYELVEEGRYWEAEDCFTSNVGLEIDYLMGII